MSRGTPEWIHSCIFRRKEERETAELGLSSPDTGTDSLGHIPLSHKNKRWAQVHTTCSYI